MVGQQPEAVLGEILRISDLQNVQSILNNKFRLKSSILKLSKELVAKTQEY